LAIRRREVEPGFEPVEAHVDLHRHGFATQIVAAKVIHVFP
jgi:hypothetical protein